MINITQWKPDTCECVISYSWDTESSPDTRVHTLHSVAHKCVHHDMHSNAQAYEKVKEENTGKNKAEKIFLENYPDYTEDNVVHGENRGKKVRSPHTFSWSFDATRKLRVSVSGMSANHRQDFQARLNQELGQGKSQVD